MEPYIKTEIENQVATIEFFHPKANSFPTEQLELLEKTWVDLGKNKTVKVIIFKSKGSSIFCVGASFDELLTIKTEEQGKRFFSGFYKVILAMKKCPKFIIGQVTGKVVGGGTGLVSSCDYALATTNALVKLSELSIGIGPFVIEPPIRRKIGLVALSELTLNPTEWKSAEWCQEKGLYNHVFTTEEELEKEVQSFAQKLSRYNPQAMQCLKSIFWEGSEDWEIKMQKRAGMSGALVLSDFTKEMLYKFKNK